MKLDLSFLLQHPENSIRAMLTIEAFAPLSMVASMPGKYYRSQPAPTPEMLYGMIENALGWHISAAERKKLTTRLQAEHGITATQTGVGFVSLLQFHLRLEQTVVPPLLHYDDLWAQHLKSGGRNYLGGSRNYDKRAIPLMNALAAKRVKIDEKAAYSKSPDKLYSFVENDEIHVNVPRPFFPQYYVSPTPREYVEPQGTYKFTFSTDTNLSTMIAKALEYPAAPLYLGSNDGWVEAQWEEMR